MFYNKELAAKIGMTTPPASIAELEAHMDKAKQAGITPIVASNQDVNSLSVFLRGTGGFTEEAGSPFAAPGTTSNGAVGDFNRDGIKDLVVSASSARLYRLQGVGDGTFTQLDTLTLDPSPSFIELTDVDDPSRRAVAKVVLSTTRGQHDVYLPEFQQFLRTLRPGPQAG